MAPIPALLEHALAGQYRVERELGAGGMATVYLVHDLKHKRLVALKLLRPELADTLAPERFQREIETAARLQHPHILTLLDSGVVRRDPSDPRAGLFWFTMPYVEGESLRERLRRDGRLGLQESLRIAREAAQALEHAHQRGVVHRDVKPDNILLSSDGSTLVADFGIARAVDAEAGQTLTETGTRIGTPSYMSPEQAGGEREVDRRTDIYSLAVVLYELLAGEPPFTGPSAQAIIAKRFTQPAPSVRAVRPDVPEPVDRAIRRALALEPADRFASAAEFAEALAEPAGRRPRPALAPELVALLFLMAAGVAVLAWREAVRGAPSKELQTGSEVPVAGHGVAILPFRAAGAELEFWREGIVDLLSPNIDGIGALRMIDPAAVIGAWRRAGGDPVHPMSTTAAVQVAREVQAGSAVTGSIVRLDDMVRLIAEVHETDGGAVRGSVVVDGPVDSVFHLVDELTLRLLRENLLPAGGEHQPAGVVRAMTTSLPALKAYLAGEREYRLGRWTAATQHYRQAVDLDSTFARAAYRLAAAYEWGGDSSDEAKRLTTRYTELAQRHAGRLSERDAMVIRADADLSPEGTAILERLTARYPDDVEGWLALGDRYYHFGGVALGSTAAYRRAFARAMQLQPHAGREVYTHLIEDAFLRLDSADARRFIAADSAIGPHDGVCPAQLVYDLLWADDAARAQALARLDRITAHDAMYGCVQAPLAVPSAPARRLARVYLDAIDTVSSAHHRTILLWRLLQLHVPRGEIGLARAAVAGAERLPMDGDAAARWQVMLHLSGYPDSAAVRRAVGPLTESARPTGLFWLGALALADRRTADFVRSVRALEQAARRFHADGDELHAGFAGAYAAVLRSYAALERGERDRLREFEATLALVPPLGYVDEQPQQYLRYRVGKLLFEWGRLDDAERYFLSFRPYDYFYTSEAELYLGRINESRGRPDRAVVHYGRAARWWNTADPLLQPLLQEARAAPARLAPQRTTR